MEKPVNSQLDHYFFLGSILQIEEKKEEAIEKKEETIEKREEIKIESTKVEAIEEKKVVAIAITEKIEEKIDAPSSDVEAALPPKQAS